MLALLETQREKQNHGVGWIRPTQPWQRVEVNARPCLTSSHVLEEMNKEVW